ncbi:hypothetical protein [Cypionkella sp.]|jgi:hypothetical protein|uniref:hypothetical protein n=1 Tax=Cypionkella sp. TaxID=2811411 RepID=UPI00375082AC
MVKIVSFGITLAVATALSGCTSGLHPYRAGPNTLIATNHDSGTDTSGPTDNDAAIAYDPDGCQGWIIDDGVEGYSGRRFDPASGLPVCNSLYPPGTVVKDYQAIGAGLRDWVPKRP